MESRMKGNFHVRFGERDVETHSSQGEEVRHVPTLHLVALVPEKQRGRFVRELTEASLDQFFEARGIEGGIEHSVVTHHRPSDDPQAPGMHDPHTHVILPGTYFDEDAGERVPLFFSRNKKVDHIELLHRCTEAQMIDLMERYVGPDWEQRYDALEAVREQQRLVVEREPDGMVVDAQGQAWPVWAGVRRTTEALSAAGTYRYFPSEEGNPRLEFRPLLLNLPHDLADEVSTLYAAHLHAYPDPSLEKLETFTMQLYSGPTAGGSTALTHEPEETRDDEPDRGLSLDL